jgi:peptidoglycan/LPS O-acetylase OafA/YrhL
LISPATELDVHLWTIPVEFRCSLYLFLVLIATARLRTWVRMAVVWSVAIFSWYNVHWELTLFFVGMIIAELDLISGAHNQSAAAPAQSGPLLGSPIEEKPSTTTTTSKATTFKSVFWSLWCLGALYLMCQPDIGDASTPGWVYLGTYVPKWWSNERYRVWQSIGSALFVYGVGHSVGWQRFFNTAVVQYFGKISYAIYLMHGPIMHTAGYMIERWAYGMTGTEGYWYNGGFVLGFVFAVPTVVWASE